MKRNWLYSHGISWATFLSLPCCFQALIIANNTEGECFRPGVYNRINVHDTGPGLRLVIDWRVQQVRAGRMAILSHPCPSWHCRHFDNRREMISLTLHGGIIALETHDTMDSVGGVGRTMQTILLFRLGV